MARAEVGIVTKHFFDGVRLPHYLFLKYLRFLFLSNFDSQNWSHLLSLFLDGCPWLGGQPILTSTRRWPWARKLKYADDGRSERCEPWTHSIPCSTCAHWEGKWTASLRLMRGKGGRAAAGSKIKGRWRAEEEEENTNLPIKVQLNTQVTFQRGDVSIWVVSSVFVAISVTVERGFCVASRVRWFFLYVGRF